MVEGIFHILLFFIITSNNLLMSILYGLMFKKIRQHLTHVFEMGQQSEITTTDKKLALFGFSTFLLNLFMEMALSLVIIGFQSDNLTVRDFGGLSATTIQDFLAYCNPWFMLLFCKAFRAHLWALIRCQEPPE